MLVRKRKKLIFIKIGNSSYYAYEDSRMTKQESLPRPRCAICNDTGWTGWEKPMSDGRGGVRMVFVPQLCRCGAADIAAEKYEQNLKAGRDNGP